MAALLARPTASISFSQTLPMGCERGRLRFPNELSKTSPIPNESKIICLTLSEGFR
jgi:hypothetical protein